MHTKPFDRMDGVKISKRNHRSCSKKRLRHNPFNAAYKLIKGCMHTKRNRRSRRSRMRLRHSLNETTANNPLPFLPEELIVNILLRLPVKPLLQFKSVCKSWETLISDSQFVNNHLQISTTYPQLVASCTTTAWGVREIISYPIKQLLENPSTPVEPVSFSSSTGHDHHDIIGSCNGLLCMFHCNQFCASLWNPSINLKSKRSPAIVSSYDNIVRYRGFGYDQLNDKYKVIVSVSSLNDDAKYVTKIYTFGENSWKTLHNFPVIPRGYLGKFVSGTLNWILSKHGVYFNKEAIVSFDLVKETYREMLLPQRDGYGVCCQGLFVLSNCLCVCFDHSNEGRWDVWMMKEYGVFDSWTKLIIIPHEKLLYTYGWQHPYVEPLFISENGVVLPLNATSSQFILYNINNGVVDYHRTFGKAITLDLHIYHESLISPQRYFEVETNDKSK